MYLVCIIDEIHYFFNKFNKSNFAYIQNWRDNIVKAKISYLFSADVHNFFVNILNAIDSKISE
jgi:hypothetical protein